MTATSPSAPPPPARPTPPSGPTREQTIGAGLAWTAAWSLRWVFIAAGAWLVTLVVQISWPILLPVLLALILTTVLEGPARFIERRLHLPATLSAAVVLVGGIGLLVAIGFTIAPSVAGQSGDIAASASDGLQKVQDWVQRSNFVTADQIDTFLQALQDRLQNSASSIAAGVVTTVGAVTNAVVNLVLTLVLTFFFLRDGRRFRPWVQSLTGKRVGHHLSEVLGRAWQTLGGFVRTQALVSLVDAVFIGLGLVLVGVPLAIPLAILTFFGGFVPIVGAFVVGAIAVLVALVANGWTAALIILAVIIAVQQLEGNVLSPWLQSRAMQLHATVVLLAVTFGSTLFGITGAFLAVPAVAVVAVVLRYLNEQVADATGESAPPDSLEVEPETPTADERTEAEPS